MNVRVVAAVALLAALAGCTGGAFTFTASPAEVPGDALESAGYEGGEPENVTVEETVEVAGAENDVTVTSWTVAYTAADGNGSLLVLSTPDVELAGQSLNPLATLSNDQLISRAVEQAGGENAEVRDVEHVGTTPATVLGAETEVDSYDAVVVSQGTEVPVTVHVATVSHEGDAVLLVGVHPQSADERDDLVSLMEAVEHDGEE